MAKMTKNTTDTQVETSNNQDNKLSAILDRLDKLEEENKQLKGEEDKNPKEKYDGPRSYSYKMWNNIPICDFESKKKDSARDFTYKNQYGEYVDNQILVLKLADGSKVETPITEFHKGYTKGEHIFPKSERTKDGISYFTFEKDGEEFEISSKIIN